MPEQNQPQQLTLKPRKIRDSGKSGTQGSKGKLLTRAVKAKSQTQGSKGKSWTQGTKGRLLTRAVKADY